MTKHFCSVFIINYILRENVLVSLISRQNLSKPISGCDITVMDYTVLICLFSQYLQETVNI